MPKHPTLLGLAVLLFAGCEDEPRGPVLPPPPPPAPRVAVAAPRPIASAGSVDLVATPEHAWLIFGPPSADGGGIRALRLSPLGEAEGTELTLTPNFTGLAPQAEEVVAAADGGRMRVAWLERNQLAFSIRSLVTSAETPAAADASTLETASRDQAGRGFLAMRSGNGVFDLLHRRSDGPCHDGGRDRCARFASHRAPNQETSRRGGGMSIPVPCAAPIVGFETAGGVWYEALCSREGDQTKTTVFAFQFEPQYAHAAPVLEGCTPYAMTTLGDGVLVRADCGAVYVSDAGRLVERWEGAPIWSCESGQPTFVWGSQRLTLAAPRDGLEALLPEGFIEPSARAIWSGQAVLAAQRIGDELAVRRFECDQGEFRRTDHEAP
ncbi:MAG: hypothetical protein AAF645_02655 [Myxococcota bacterium]